MLFAEFAVVATIVAVTLTHEFNGEQMVILQAQLQ